MSSKTASGGPSVSPSVSEQSNIRDIQNIRSILVTHNSRLRCLLMKRKVGKVDILSFLQPQGNTLEELKVAFGDALQPALELLEQDFLVYQSNGIYYPM